MANNNNNNPKLKIISDCFIKPKFDKIQCKTPHYLSSNDLFQLSTSYMHRGLLYAKPPPSSSSSSILNIDSTVDNLKQSISLALVDFYPLSGRLETVKYPNDDHSSWVYVDCNKGSGARFIHATTTEECSLTISDIVTCYESISRFMWALFDGGDLNVVNHDGHSRALLSVQVTDLVDGVFIGFTMNHSLGDGMSLWCFINALSKIFMNNSTRNDEINNIDVEKPVFKAVFSDGFGPVMRLPYLDPIEFITRLKVDPRLRLRIFHFSAESIARLKAQANEKSDTKISSFQALSAFMWVSITRARNQPDDSNTDCWLTADTRPKHDPPLSPNHFGNFVHLIRVASKVNDLMRDGLGRVSMLLNKSITGLDDKVVRANLKARDETPHVAQLTQISKYFGDNPPLIFTGSMRFDAYGPEFGLGKAVATRPGYSIWMNGRIIIDPGREGGGSVDLHVCLLSDVMKCLECDDKFISYVSSSL